METGINPMQPFAIPYNNSSPGSSDAVEMLQTDVMRFFAILCLCLMAIFALVKALPLAESDRPPNVEPADLKKEAQSLPIQIAALKENLAEIKRRSQTASVEAERSAGRARKAAENERAILNRLADTRQDLKKVLRSLDQTRSQLNLGEFKLAGLEKEIDQKRQFRSDLTYQITSETQKLKRTQTALERAKTDVSQPQPRQAPDELPQPPGSKTADRQGHVLRFASEAVLQTLISAGKVKFYAMAGQRAWQLRWTGSRLDFIAGRHPPQIYEMEPATVPARYMAAFKQQVAAFGGTTMTWGVTLPAQTKAHIQRLVNGNSGGELVIMPDGNVNLK